MLDSSFESQCERVNGLVESGCITKELGSILLSYYAMGRNEAANENCDARAFAKANFNPDHDECMAAFRNARPAKLIIE
ncbi:hypothetical protein A3715_32445 [Oleiphilus sp. HI0009]|nr:hypothetical protein A3715_11245 [Oleiphilus sp. HI0009]KZX83276.1 hypothetical protein A3715_32445 [Oleiphilus sp. HI0009]